MNEQRHVPVDIQLDNGGIVRVQILSPRAFRIRLRQDKRFREPALVRYGIVRAEGQPTACDVEDQAEEVVFRTDEATLAIRREDGKMTLTDGAGNVLTRDAVPPWSDPDRGFGSRQPGVSARHQVQLDVATNVELVGDAQRGDGSASRHLVPALLDGVGDADRPGRSGGVAGVVVDVAQGRP